MTNHAHRSTLVAGVLLLSVATCAGQSPGRIFSGTGVALTPKNFPEHTGADVAEMFEQGRELGEYAVFIYQWSQADHLDVAKEMMKQSKKAGLTPVLALSPTVLAGARSEYHAPESVRRAAGRNLSFKDKKVHLPYIEAALELAKLKPPYLCLATEINFLAFKDIQEYLVFAHVYKKLYPEIKKVSPDTKVFVSFQWDFFHIMDRDEPDKIKEHSKLIDVFRPELDLVALTSYPVNHFPSVEAVPANYYDNVFNHVSKSEEVMFMEIGWPTSGKGSVDSQRAFIAKLPELMGSVKPSLIVWSLLHDVRLSGLSDELAATGLRSPTGTKKAGYDAFVSLREK